jgi:hypothetical protein
MVNGKAGDHPFTDIVLHGRQTISTEVTALVQEIYRFGDDELNRVVSDLLWFMNPEEKDESWRETIRSSLEHDLRTIRNITVELRRSRGWESGDEP